MATLLTPQAFEILLKRSGRLLPHKNQRRLEQTIDVPSAVALDIAEIAAEMALSA
ncbi:MAG: hypothetical protein U0326_15835 [Polyangiales bacterium]